jgi:hypothetical protein
MRREADIEQRIQLERGSVKIDVIRGKPDPCTSGRYVCRKVLAREGVPHSERVCDLLIELTL